jgi:hypothetical protein
MSKTTWSIELLFIGLVTVTVAVFGSPAAAASAATICAVLAAIASSGSSTGSDEDVDP